MDQHKASYIVKYFPRLMEMDERAAWWHHFAMSKIEQTPTGMEGAEVQEWQRSKIEFYKEQGMISSDAAVLAKLENGYDAFILATANRVLADSKEDLFLNNCPNCGELARTPQSKQCRHCGTNWHDQVAATFKHRLTRAHSAKPDAVVFEGDLIKGELETGMKVDLTYFGLNQKPAIDVVQAIGEDKYGIEFEVEGDGMRAVLVDAGIHIEPINIEF